MSLCLSCPRSSISLLADNMSRAHHAACSRSTSFMWLLSLREGFDYQTGRLIVAASVHLGDTSPNNALTSCAYGQGKTHPLHPRTQKKKTVLCAVQIDGQPRTHNGACAWSHEQKREKRARSLKIKLVGMHARCMVQVFDNDVLDQ